MEFVQLDGIRLECRWIGAPSPDIPVLVFLHEGLGSVSLWRDFPDQMAAATGLPAFVYSRQGYGGSSPVEVPRPLDYLQREGRDTLPCVLDAAGIERAILVGHSDGATIALVHAALDRFGRVSGVAVLAPHTFVEPVCVEAIGRVRDTYDEILRPRLLRHHGTNVDGAFWGWNRAWLDPGFTAMDIRPLLPSIRVPVLVIQGEEDEYATAAQVDAVVSGVGGSVRALMLPQCGHSPHRDQAIATRAELCQWVKAITPPSR